MLIRPLVPSDDADIERLFRDTMFLGHPPPFRLARARPYAELCLAWYLTVGREDAAVAVDEDGRVRGYALVCTDRHSYRLHTLAATLRFVASTAVFAASGRLDRLSRTFYAARALDAWGLSSNSITPPMPAHAHLNLDPAARGRGAANALFDHIDERVRRSGAAGWYGEMNAEPGHRAAALGRLGLVVAGRRENCTLSRTLSRPVERLTIVRRFPADRSTPRPGPWSGRCVEAAPA